MQIYKNFKDSVQCMNFNLEFWDPSVEVTVMCIKCGKTAEPILLRAPSVSLISKPEKIKTFRINGLCKNCMSDIPEEAFLTKKDMQAFQDELDSRRAEYDPAMALPEETFITKSVEDAKQAFSEKSVMVLKKHVASGFSDDFESLLEHVELQGLKGRNGKAYKRLSKCVNKLKNVGINEAEKNEIVQEFGLWASKGYKTDKQWEQVVLMDIRTTLDKYTEFSRDEVVCESAPMLATSLNVQYRNIPDFGAISSEYIRLSACSVLLEKIESSRETLEGWFATDAED